MLRQAKHVFKLDPQKNITDASLEATLTSQTDLIMISGTDGVTRQNISDLLERIKSFNLDKSIALEISHPDTVVPGFDYYYVPSVINTKNIKYAHGLLIEALMEYHEFIEYENIRLLPYIVMNEHCKAFNRAECTLMNDEEFLAAIHMLDKLYKMDFIYVEYSGTYGDYALVKEAFDACENSHLLYGGGIQSHSEATQMAKVSDTIVVGNIIYDDIEQALTTII
ncbi:heptaprenylglyceryl phosphate synthase [Jeotgalicoccus sp. ATCC 8456]|uniref:heptaprenylglyceryl phosphate synthase n=1 Tax=Jeotgalicoccus sp. ATCC 8456 TaxID=946435 RepID=UPI0018E62135|nr:heptaprenylglyceryl phosphate synthase [Jeotgalicoccus sp. ATCC 8456]QQD85033.1 heptaprenylglyceryl phosphate synthase [Jeotgalicoccus sp. ATCC 8456]